MVYVECYGIVTTYQSRKDAINDYLDCIRHSEGAERERYLNIYLDLISMVNGSVQMLIRGQKNRKELIEWVFGISWTEEWVERIFLWIA